MIWLLITIVSLGVIALGYVLDAKNTTCYSGETIGGGILAFTCSFFFFILAGIEGGADYATLLGRRAEAETYARYVDNIESLQGTDIRVGDLSMEANSVKAKVDFISGVAEKVSAYNSYLAKCKRVKQSTILFWLREGAFMSDKIMELEPIK